MWSRSYVVEVTGEKLVGRGLFDPPPPPTILNWVKYMAVNKNTKVFFAPLPFGHPYLLETRTYKNVSEKMIGDMLIEEKMDVLRKEN